ncbi:MAG TPA: DNA mismatch repair protein MutS [Candidatus Azoamicus sp. OHIO2]
MSDYTPIMQQYIKIKKQHKNKILFFRLGDFYELFFKDAILCSHLLMLHLTSRGKYKNKNIPMCGFPYNSVNYYIAKLMQYGKHVALCEQTSKNNKSGLIERHVTNIFTPGTFVNENYLKDNINNYIICVYIDNNIYGLACIDIAVGYFFINQINNLNDLQTEIYKINPTEILMSDTFKNFNVFNKTIHIQKIKQASFNYLEALKILKNILPSNVGIESMFLHLKQALTAAGYLLKYILNNQTNIFTHINKIEIYNLFDLLYIDKNTIKNLELFKSNSGIESQSLFSTMDRTVTAMGKRFFKRWLTTPLVSSNERLQQRVRAVTSLKKNKQLLDVLIMHLKKVSDLDKLLFNIIKKIAKLTDLKKIEQSLEYTNHIKIELNNFQDDVLLTEIHDNIHNFTILIKLINKALICNPHNNISDGNFIQDLFDKQIDHYRFEITNINKRIKNYQIKEQKNINYKQLKILSNKEGYFITLPKKIKVPITYEKIKELSTSIRYTSQELKNIEMIKFHYNDLLLNREIKIYNILCYRIKKNIKKIQDTTKYIGILDVIASFANISHAYSWCEQQFVNYSTIQIKNGRHPTIELNNLGNFIPNDSFFDEKNKAYIITGPNMGGKSTYMRQIALITLLSHIGSHVPASEVIIGNIDKIFTRIGANDDITNAMSTFMLEMTEISEIIIKATNSSLILIDEIGRGTNYLEGKSLALSILSEFIIEKKSFLLFSTHFHDISYISSLYPYVKSIYFKAIYHNNKLIFLYKYFNGVSNKGFATNVAEIAGMPKKIIVKAEYYLAKFKLEEHNKLKFNNNVMKINNGLITLKKYITEMKYILNK